MRTITALMAATFIVVGCGLAGAQSSGSSGTGGAGAAPAAPQLDTSRPTGTPPQVLRRGDEMAPMQGSNVSNQTFNQTGMSKKKMKTHVNH